MILKTGSSAGLLAVTALVVLAEAFVPPQAAAQVTISWGAATNISGDSDVISNGVPLYAYAGTATTLNGVPFAAVNSGTTWGGVSLSGFGRWASNSFGSAGGTFGGLSPAYSNVLSGGAYGGISAGTVTLTGLTAGHDYLVQIWLNDSRGNIATEYRTAAINGTTMTVVYDTTQSVGGVGQYAVGSFVAAGPSQSFTLTPGSLNSSYSTPSVQLNAISVLDNTPPTLVWQGDGGVNAWDYATPNWNSGGSATDYADGSAVVFDDTGSASPSLALNTEVAPASVTFSNNAVNYTLTGSGGIGGSASLTLNGSGSVYLQTANTYTGGTTLNAGEIYPWAGSALGTGPVTANAGTKVYLVQSETINNSLILNGGTLDASAGDYYTIICNGSLTVNANSSIVGDVNLYYLRMFGNVYLNSGATLTTLNLNFGSYRGFMQMFGTISGPGSMLVLNTNYLDLYGSNTFSGGLTVGDGVNGGNVFMGTNSCLGTGPVLINTNSAIYSIVSTIIPNPITLNGGTIWVQGAVNGTLGTYPGTLTVSNNSKIMTQNGAAGSLFNNSTNAISLGSGGCTLTIGGFGGQTTIAGPISGLGSLFIPGPTHQVLLQGSNSYSGLTTISNKNVRLIAGTANISPNTTFNIAGSSSGGGQLYLNSVSGSGITSNNFTISGVGYADNYGVNFGAIRLVGNNLSGVINLAGNARIGSYGGAGGTLTGQITGGNGIDFYNGNGANNQTGTFVMANTGAINNYSGNTSISSGDYKVSGGFTGCKCILELGANEQIPNGPGDGMLQFNGVDANHVSVFELNGFSETINGLSNASPAGAVIQNTASGASTLTIGDADTSSSFSGSITDGGVGKTLAFTKIGVGTLTLLGANTYTGTTTVSNGTLLVNGSLGSSAVTNCAGAILGGSGAIGGNVTFASGSQACFTVGAPLTISGSLTLNNNTVQLNLPANLGVGTYTLATYNPTGSTGVFKAAPVVNTGSFATFTTVYITTAGGQVNLVVGNYVPVYARVEGGIGGPVKITTDPSIAGGNPAFVLVQLAPPAAVQAGAAWRLCGLAGTDLTTLSDFTNFSSAYPTVAVTTTNGFAVEFQPIAGWNLPLPYQVSLTPGALDNVSGNYTVTNPVMVASPASGIGLSGTPGTSYLIQACTNLTSGVWQPLQTNTLGAGINYVLPWPPTNGGSGFYRAVWLGR